MGGRGNLKGSDVLRDIVVGGTVLLKWITQIFHG
jgi:hypothetical protein